MLRFRVIMNDEDKPVVMCRGFEKIPGEVTLAVVRITDSRIPPQELKDMEFRVACMLARQANDPNKSTPEARMCRKIMVELALIIGGMKLVPSGKWRQDGGHLNEKIREVAAWVANEVQFEDSDPDVEAVIRRVAAYMATRIEAGVSLDKRMVQHQCYNRPR